jgi:hypothetical protein
MCLQSRMAHSALQLTARCVQTLLAKQRACWCANRQAHLNTQTGHTIGILNPARQLPNSCLVKTWVGVNAKRQQPLQYREAQQQLRGPPATMLSMRTASAACASTCTRRHSLTIKQAQQGNSSLANAIRKQAYAAMQQSASQCIATSVLQMIPYTAPAFPGKDCAAANTPTVMQGLCTRASTQ